MSGILSILGELWVGIKDTFVKTIIQVVTVFIIWIVYNAYRIFRSQKWKVNGATFSVMDVTRKIDSNNEKIYEYFTIYGYVSPSIYKIKRLISKVIHRRFFYDELDAMELFGVAKNKSEDNFITIQRPDGKKVEYHKIINCYLGKTQYLLWKPYEITFQKMGDSSNMRIVLEIKNIHAVKNDWNL